MGFKVAAWAISMSEPITVSPEGNEIQSTGLVSQGGEKLVLACSLVNSPTMGVCSKTWLKKGGN
jgi:hypothetical protein